MRRGNSEAFAGQHNKNSTSFFLFDESSLIPDKIWEVADSGLTDGEPMWFAFGNGALRDMVCRGLLLLLHRAGEIELPPIRFRTLNPFVRREPPAPVLIDTTPIIGALSDETHRPNRPIKEVFGLPLTRHFRELLTQL